MSLFRDDISDTIRNTKLFCKEYLTKIIELENNGNDIKTDKIIFVVLHQWITILERYYDANWDSEGDAIDPPTEVCLERTYVEELLDKMTSAIGNKNYQISDWILAFGIWNDNGFWRDSAVWIDT